VGNSLGCWDGKHLFLRVGACEKVAQSYYAGATNVMHLSQDGGSEPDADRSPREDRATEPAAVRLRGGDQPSTSTSGNIGDRP